MSNGAVMSRRLAMRFVSLMRACFHDIRRVVPTCGACRERIFHACTQIEIKFARSYTSLA